MDADDSHRGWAEHPGNFLSEYYTQIDPNEVSETFAAVFEHYAAEDTLTLEFGCNFGRHLARLHDRGYEDITGIDINDDSFEVMAGYFPEFVDTGTLLTDAIEDLLPDFPDGKSDVIYSVETLQHVHPDDTWMFEEITRISSGPMITAENEGNGPTRGHLGSEASYVNDDLPLYHRNWKDKFSEFGLAQLLCKPGKRDMVRVFRVL